MKKIDLTSYYLLQYERIDRLENKRENFCNYVITLTSAIFTIGFIFLEKIDFQYGSILVSFIIILNFASILYIWRTRPWIKLHQKRAKLALEKSSIAIVDIEKEALKELKKPKSKSHFLKFYTKYTNRLNSDGDIFRRSLIYSFLHWIIIGFSIFALTCMKNISEHPKKVESCHCVIK